MINTIINYKYDNLKNDINRLTHLYQFYDSENNLSYKITLDNHDFRESDFNNNVLNVKDNFCLNLTNIYDKIKVILSLIRINEWGAGNIGLQMVDNDYINIINAEKLISLKNLIKMKVLLHLIWEK